MPLSPEMDERVLNFIEDGIAKRKSKASANLDPMHHILVCCLEGAEEDRTAIALMRLIEDWDKHPGQGALGRVLSGDVDLVALLGEGQ